MRELLSIEPKLSIRHAEVAKTAMHTICVTSNTVSELGHWIITDASNIVDDHRSEDLLALPSGAKSSALILRLFLHQKPNSYTSPQHQSVSWSHEQHIIARCGKLSEGVVPHTAFAV